MYNIPSNVKYLLFDCDGTLAKTQHCHCEAYKISFNYYNIPFTEYEFYNYSQQGSNNLKEKMILSKNYSVEIFDKICKMKSEIISTVLDDKMIPNYELIDFIKQNKNKYKMAVVSNGKKHSINTIINKLGISDCFEFIITAEDYKKSKPNPDPYLAAVNKFETNANECLIFEDNDIGFKAAKNANINYIKVNTFKELNNMKGVILAGGRGSRLSPLTDIVNKFLLPVYNKVMIEYSVENLVNCGITDIAIIIGPKSAGETMNYLKSGKKYGAKITYFFQENPMGVPDALNYAKDFVGNNNVMVLCADNIILDDLNEFKNNFTDGCFISCKKFDSKDELKKFAVAKVKNNKIECLEEKPSNPSSDLAFCGVQIYSSDVFDKIETLELSDRGEYEITHVINSYINEDRFSYDTLKDQWFDCGTPKSLYDANEYIYKKTENI